MRVDMLLREVYEPWHVLVLWKEMDLGIFSKGSWDYARRIKLLIYAGDTRQREDGTRTRRGGLEGVDGFAKARPGLMIDLSRSRALYE